MRFAIREAVHGWEWTYTGITRAGADGIARQLSEGTGETWTVEPIS